MRWVYNHAILVYVGRGGGGLLNGPEALNVHFVKVNLCTAYCYKTIISQYAIITDSAGVQPIGCRLGLRPRAHACG